MQVTFTADAEHPLDLMPAEVTPEELTEGLTECPVGEKEGLSLIPAIFKPCPNPCSNTGVIKCSGGELHRLGRNVEAMTGFLGDFDHTTEEQFDALVSSLGARGLLFWAWETFSHKPGAPRYRIFVPFAEPLSVVSPAQWSKGAWPAIVSDLGFDNAVQADPACKDPARVYYMPRRPSEDEQRAVFFHDGNFYYPLPVVQAAMEHFKAAAMVEVRAPEEDPSKAVDLENVRKRLKSIHKRGTAGLIRNITAGRPPVGPTSKRLPGEPTRYEAWRRVTGALAAVAQEWESTEALLEILKPAHNASVADDPEDHTPWEVICRLLSDARSGMPKYKAEQEAERQAKLTMAQNALRKAYGGPPVGNEPIPTKAEVGNAHNPTVGFPQTVTDKAIVILPTEASISLADSPIQTTDAWDKGLIWTEKNGMPAVQVSARNVGYILKHHPLWEGMFRRNELGRVVEMWGGPTMDPSEPPRRIQDADFTAVCNWLSEQPLFQINLPEQIIRAQINLVARANRYDPLNDYLAGLEWDGTPRINTFLERYLGVRVKDAEGKDVTLYIRAVSRKWLISAVARGLDPGCKVDTVLQLESSQGAGKSTAMRILGGDFFTDQAVDIHSKDTLQLISTKWIVELPELEAIRRSEDSAKKAFFSKREDEFRKPYGHEIEAHPRRCVFGGTTNNDDYLSDPTGNRRYLVVDSGVIDTVALRRDRDQLWAEAVAVYQAGLTCEECKAAEQERCPEHMWWLTEEEQSISNRQAEEKMSNDLTAEAVCNWILKKPKEGRPTEIGTVEICEEVLQKLPNRGNQIQIGRSLKRMGFKKIRRRLGRSLVWRFEVPIELLTAEPIPQKSVLQRVAEAKGIKLVEKGSTENGSDKALPGSAEPS